MDKGVPFPQIGGMNMKSTNKEPDVNIGELTNVD